MTFASSTVEDFHADLADDAPTPGGGSAAAIAAAGGAATVEMVCHVTRNDDDFEAVHDEMGEVATELADLRGALHAGADEDAAAFDDVMAAFRRDGDDPDRAGAIESAMTRAAEVPLETARQCLAIIEHAGFVAREGNQNAVTDAGTGAWLAYAALRSALYNVDINLASIDDEATVEELREERDDLLERAEAALATVTDHVDGAL